MNYNKINFIDLSLSIIILSAVFGCTQTHKNITNIELTFINDSTDKAECFADFYKFRLDPLHKDSLIPRFAYPFKYVAVISGTDDWKSIIFNSQKELTSYEEFDDLISSISLQIPFDSRFKNIFATKEKRESSLKISEFNKNDRCIYARFITDKGQWFIKSFQEVPVFDDGGIPVEDD